MKHEVLVFESQGPCSKSPMHVLETQGPTFEALEFFARKAVPGIEIAGFSFEAHSPWFETPLA